MSDRPLPWSPASELHVIGASLVDPSLPSTRCALDPEDFYDGINRQIWEAIVQLSRNGGYSTSVDVWNVLAAAGATVDHRERLVHAEEDAGMPAFGPPNAKVVRRLAALRRFAVECGRAWEQASDPKSTADPEAYIESKAAIVAAAARDFELTAGAPGVTVADAIALELEALQVRMRDPGNHSRILTGYPDIDRMIIGFEKPDYIVLGARPSMGKTSLVLQMVANACNAGHAVSLFSLEQGTPRITQRMLSQQSEAPFRSIRTGERVNDAMVDRILKAERKMRDWRLTIRDDAGMTPSAIKAAVAADKAKGCDLVVVDHLHHVRPDERNQSRYVQVSDISKAFKAMAKDLDVPVLLCAQLSRDGHNATSPPSLRHLRDSGTIEEDADVIFFLHRDDYYDPDKRKGQADVMVAKCRDGETGRVELRWRPQCLRFDNASRWE